eukprot:CAMPEP_0202704246 /NCGR_PEP_ID=MMETSP1385-20130828/16953_1 /ASSEMBLY_ACC=CAM_ASM_000861 /TAXON_ID=933848 /ORGANISM="Elphidium margaritaceum" /LENGTH=106 /DNA_ID=CAMNT_0049362223 /DNA_START=99 /DNA_END=415 /DNA_ORIENTATION=-
MSNGISRMRNPKISAHVAFYLTQQANVDTVMLVVLLVRTLIAMVNLSWMRPKKTENEQSPTTSDLNAISMKEAQFLNRIKMNNLKPFPITKKIVSHFNAFDALYHP